MKNKNRILIFPLIAMGLILVLTNRCKKEHVSIAPTLETSTISSIALTTAAGGGNVTSDGGATVTGRGVCWSTGATPTIGDSKTTDGAGTGSFNSSITGLTANTTYNVRAYATNGVGTAYGNEVTFTTYGLMDIDGNGYHSIVIGTQEWMKENLKTTTYRDGSAIPKVTDATAWTNLSTGAYCEYNNATNNVAIYGRLYNWFAVTDARLLCPTGWHAPDDSEWDLLATYLGGGDVAGGKMKTTGTSQTSDGLWNSPNTGATNESGFAGLPGGDRGDVGGFNDVRDYGMWWTTVGVAGYADFRHLHSFDAKLTTSNNFKINGKSVRCLKD